MLHRSAEFSNLLGDGCRLLQQSVRRLRSSVRVRVDGAVLRDEAGRVVRIMDMMGKLPADKPTLAKKPAASKPRKSAAAKPSAIPCSKRR
jgi:hypothetical protein